MNETISPYKFKVVTVGATRRVEVASAAAEVPTFIIGSRLEAMSAGSIGRLIRLAKGRAQAPDLWAVCDGSSRVGAFYELYYWLQAPVAEVRNLVLEALQGARRDQRRRRKFRARFIAALPLRLALAEVASVIMRHGPPRSRRARPKHPGRGERVLTTS